MPEVSDLELLELHAIRAADGAADAQKRIGSLIDFHFGETAFAIKSRIKSHASIVGKVHGRGNDFSCAAVRDIVGFRIIDLYRMDVPKTLKTFYSLILLGSNTDLFPATPPEIKIYKPRVDDDLYQEALATVLSDLDLKVEVKEKESNYSSIHLLTSCRVQFRGQIKSVPIEVQFRSAIEDVWSEMEHKLKYKGNLQSIDVGEDTTKRDFVDYLLKQMAAQKVNFDALETQAGGINEQRMKLTQPHAAYTPARSEVVVADRLKSVLETAGLERALVARDRALLARGQANKIAHQPPSLISPEQTHEALGLYETSTVNFGDVLKAVEQAREVTSPGPRSFAIAIARMEIAFNSYLMGLFARKVQIEAKASGLLHDASRTYSELLVEGAPFIIIRYRLAQVRFAVGDFEGATALLEQVIAGMDEDEDVKGRPNHWLRSECRRFLGLVMWNAAERMKDLAVSSNQPDYKHTERVALYTDALKVTLDSLSLRVEGAVGGEPGMTEDGETAAHLRKASNNALAYLSDLRQLGVHTRVKSELKITKKKIATLLEQMRAKSIEDIWELPSPEQADTVILTYEELADGAPSPEQEAIICAASKTLVYLVARDAGLTLPGPREEWTAEHYKGVLEQLRRRDVGPRMDEMLTVAVRGLSRCGFSLSWGEP